VVNISIAQIPTTSEQQNAVAIVRDRPRDHLFGCNRTGQFLRCYLPRGGDIINGCAMKPDPGAGRNFEPIEFMPTIKGIIAGHGLAPNFTVGSRSRLLFVCS